MSRKRLVALTLLVMLSGTRSFRGEPALRADEKSPHADRAALIKQFAERLSGATLAGRYSTDGKEDANPPVDRYEIERAERVEGDRWVITARIKYGKNDLKVPIALDVFWAQDTPVISLTNVTIPALGTFTARVMFYGDRYAGTWQHDKVGGHMWGRIESAKKPADEKTGSSGPWR